MSAKEISMATENKSIVPESGAKTKKFDTMKLAGIGLLTAIVIVLQLISLGMRFGMFSITFVLIPIVVGAALYGWKAGAWLGFVFGVVVVLTDAGAFLAVDVIGTVITCLLKGALAGTAAGVVYNLIAKKNKIAAVIVAAVITPIVNTGVFLLGCVVFFFDTVSQWAAGAGFENVGTYMIMGLVGINFIIELGVNLILNPVIVRIIDIGKSSKLKNA